MKIIKQPQKQKKRKEIIQKVSSRVFLAIDTVPIPFRDCNSSIIFYLWTLKGKSSFSRHYCIIHITHARQGSHRSSVDYSIFYYVIINKNANDLTDNDKMSTISTNIGQLNNVYTQVKRVSVQRVEVLQKMIGLFLDWRAQIHQRVSPLKQKRYSYHPVCPLSKWNK